MFTQLSDIRYDGYSTEDDEMNGIPDHLETRRQMLRRTRRKQRARWVLALGLGAMAGLAVLSLVAR